MATKTICDLCGNDASDIYGMTKGDARLADEWNHGPGMPDKPHTIEVKILVSAMERSHGHHKKPIDMCQKCLDGFIANLPKLRAKKFAKKA